jgi:hypothetical protein
VFSGLFHSHHRVTDVFVAPVSSTSPLATQDTPRFAHFPSIFHCSRSPDPHRAAGAPSPSTQGLPVSSPLLKRSRVPSRGEQTPHALNFPFTALLSAQSLAGVELRRHWAAPSWIAPSGASAPVLCPQLSLPCHPSSLEPFPNALEPRRGHALASGETSPRSRAPSS